MPFLDYSTTTYLLSGLSKYTAPSNGMLSGAISVNANNDCKVKVNGSIILRIRETVAINTNCYPYTILLSKGDIVEWIGATSSDVTIFTYFKE